jgi:hypothetical protein
VAGTPRRGSVRFPGTFSFPSGPSSVPHGGAYEGGRSTAPWCTYTGTQPETADTDKETLNVLVDSSSTQQTVSESGGLWFLLPAIVCLPVFDIDRR